MEKTNPLKPVRPQTPTGASATASPMQADRSTQFQDLPVNQYIMQEMKPANARAQLKAMQALTADPSIDTLKVLDVGGGDGLTSPVWDAVVATGKKVSIQATEHESKYHDTYRKAHSGTGVAVDRILPVRWQALEPANVDGPVHVVFMSHSAYFILDDMFIMSNRLPAQPLTKSREEVAAILDEHPLTKAFDLLQDGGIAVVTLGSAQELRPMTRLMTDAHGFDIHQDPSAIERIRTLTLADLEAYRAKSPDNLKLKTSERDKDVESLLKMLDCHKNMLLFKRHLRVFGDCYQYARQCRLSFETFSSQTEVEIGQYEAVLNPVTKIYDLHVHKAPVDPQSWTAKIFAHFGSWPVANQVAAMSKEQLIKVRDTQTVFLNMLALYAAGGKLYLSDDTLSIRKTASSP